MIPSGRGRWVEPKTLGSSVIPLRLPNSSASTIFAEFFRPPILSKFEQLLHRSAKETGKQHTADYAKGTKAFRGACQ